MKIASTDMLTHYHTLKALSQEWNALMSGCTIIETYSQQRDELSIVLSTGDEVSTLRLSCKPQFRFVFRMVGHNKARKNVASLFEQANGCVGDSVEVADMDRFLFLNLSNGASFQIHLFGPRPNVFLVDRDRTVISAFLHQGDWIGQPAPEPRPTPPLRSFDQFASRWQKDRKTTLQALAASIPLLDALLASEVLHRAEVSPSQPPALGQYLERLYRESMKVISELEAPAPCIYFKNDRVDAFSLIRLKHRTRDRVQSFSTVDEAVRSFTRASMADRRFFSEFEPLVKAISSAKEKLDHRVSRVESELTKESRADQYEKWGHLLMAAPPNARRGEREISLPDVLSDGGLTEIPLEASQSLIENAETYYDKARKSRQAREHALERWIRMREEKAESARLLRGITRISTLRDLRRFKEEESDALEQFLSENSPGADGFPFRRFALPEDFEVWVGKNARQNDELTFRYADKFDYWLHARGVPGSHVILRRPNRSQKPGRHILEPAASVAAFFSAARKSSLVPVIVAEKKHVRKAKGAPPGTVKVEREQVLLVEPRLPLPVT